MVFRGVGLVVHEGGELRQSIGVFRCGDGRVFKCRVWPSRHLWLLVRSGRSRLGRRAHSSRACASAGAWDLEVGGDGGFQGCCHTGVFDVSPDQRGFELGCEAPYESLVVLSCC